MKKYLLSLILIGFSASTIFADDAKKTSLERLEGAAIKVNSGVEIEVKATKKEFPKNGFFQIVIQNKKAIFTVQTNNRDLKGYNPDEPYCNLDPSPDAVKSSLYEIARNNKVGDKIKLKPREVALMGVPSLFEPELGDHVSFQGTTASSTDGLRFDCYHVNSIEGIQEILGEKFVITPGSVREVVPVQEVMNPAERAS